MSRTPEEQRAADLHAERMAYIEAHSFDLLLALLDSFGTFSEAHFVAVMQTGNHWDEIQKEKRKAQP